MKIIIFDTFSLNKFIINLTYLVYYISSLKGATTVTLLSVDEIRQFCLGLDCTETSSRPVCGVKRNDNEFKYKVFKNECLLLLDGCTLSNFSKAYGRTDLSKCQDKITSEFIPDLPEEIIVDKHIESRVIDSTKNAFENNTSTKKYVFENTTEVIKSKTLENVEIKLSKTVDINKTKLKDDHNSDNYNQNIFVVDSFETDINTMNYEAYIDDFFNSTHYKNYTVTNDYDINHPTKKYEDINLEDYEDPYFIGEINPPTFRRAVTVKSIPKLNFEFFRIVPKNKTGLKETIQSCYHNCPKECPDFYAPVCGIPGAGAREPALVFKNHCLMDMAQCKVYRENKSPTARKLGYVESKFIFCLGDSMNGAYRFLPMLRTLQRMGRIRPKGRFKYRVRNFRFYNDRSPIGFKPMGK